jgi:hypothetical protein
MFTETVNVTGRLKIVRLDDSGNEREVREVKNLIVAVGKNIITSRLVGNTTAIPSHMAVGSSNTAATTAQTALGTELSRVSLDSSTRTNNTIAYIATFPAGVGTGTITEAGIFNAGSSGSMLCRTNFNEVNKAAGDVIVITWNVTIS